VIPNSAETTSSRNGTISLTSPSYAKIIPVIAAHDFLTPSRT